MVREGGREGGSGVMWGLRVGLGGDGWVIRMRGVKLVERRANPLRIVKRG